MRGVGEIMVVLTVATASIVAGCDSVPGVPKTAGSKTEEVRQNGPPSITPTIVRQEAQLKGTPTARAALAPTSTPVLPTPSPTPSPSPDVVFVRDGNLWLAKVKSGSQVPLTVDGGNSSPRWSPDGSHIVFVHSTGSVSELHRVGVNGNDRRRLVGGDALYGDPKWSPTGDAVLFVVKRDGNRDGKLDEKDASEVWLMNADGSSARKLAEGTDPTWAPEGLRIAFATSGKLENDVPYRRANSINVINRQGKNEWVLISTSRVPVEITLGQSRFNTGVFLLTNPVWSSASKLIAFTAIGHTGMILSVTEKATDQRIWASNYEGGFGRSAWSPVGELLAYESHPPSGVKSIGIASSPAKQPVAIGGVRTGIAVHSPAWSADGRFLAFAQDSGTKFIGIVDADGNDLRQLATGNVSQPDWNPRSR